ncbi:DnaJ domain-containing protein [Hansschlegelia plantiphila]|uniref:J domain-containing protein n=1 Tax=Hansschlegelia plantiphila TaxID=374655 RepID=A0A9W6J033_9HYPH|nr:hypothetical protein GCM10008179_18750 [Hansschlegelia plantiphila]
MIWIVFGALALATILAVGRILVDADPSRARKPARIVSMACWGVGLALTFTGKPLVGMALMGLGALGTGAFARRPGRSGFGERDRDRRSSFGGSNGEAHGDARGRGGRAPGRAGVMTEEEAYQILGLQPGAGPEEIARAHRSLMKKVHPDQGGTTDLAARVNAAKDVLSERRHR